MDNRETCQICNVCERKYVCPRCNIQFCSVECYKNEKHKQCSETFYRECVLNELKLEGGDLESEMKMLEILKRHQTQEDEELDSDDDLELSERLKGVDLDDADTVWQCLTECEQQEFEALVRSGDVTDLLPLWEPWWCYKKKKPLVEEVGPSDSSSDKPWVKGCPPLKKNIPQFTQISKHPPSSEIKWNIVNVVAAYCYAARYFNGDHLNHPLEAAHLLEKLSGTLHTNYNYQTAGAAVDAVIQDIVSCFGQAQETIEILKDDVRKVLSGPDENNSCYYIKTCLSDIYQLFTLAHKMRKSDLQINNSEFSLRFKDGLCGGDFSMTKEQLFLLKKKFEFYLSWANAYLVKTALNY